MSTRSSDKVILILGGGVMQLPAVRLAKQKGWTVVAAAAGIGEEIEQLADACKQVDLRDREAVARVARGIKGSFGLDGVFTAGTDFSTTVAWVAEQVGLPGIPYRCALAATDKSRMREVFEAQGVPSPPFFTVTKETASLPAGFSFPLVVKPVDSMGARGVRRVDDEQQLLQGLEAALQQSGNGRAIVEQFLEGPELSLDALVYDGRVTICGVADRHICFPPHFVEMGHTLPTALDAASVRSVEEVFIRGIHALGIHSGAAKGDIKMTPAGAVVGEIAARLSGGYMSGWTFPFASGVEVTEAALNIAVGLPPGDLTPKRDWVSAERAFISIPGTVEALEGLEQALQQSGIEELFLRVSEGQQVELPINNMGKCGNLISKAPSRREAVEAVQTAVQTVLVRLKPGSSRTEEYLNGSYQRGFSAFSGLSPQGARILAALPPYIGDLTNFSRRRGDVEILVPPHVELEEVRDWHGFTLEAAFRRVVEITGARPVDSVGVEPSPAQQRKSGLTLGHLLWKALIKGGVQAGVYLIDTLCDPAGNPKQVVRRWLGWQ